MLSHQRMRRDSVLGYWLQSEEVERPGLERAWFAGACDGGRVGTGSHAAEALGACCQIFDEGLEAMKGEPVVAVHVIPPNPPMFFSDWARARREEAGLDFGRVESTHSVASTIVVRAVRAFRRGMSLLGWHCEKPLRSPWTAHCEKCRLLARGLS